MSSVYQPKRKELAKVKVVSSQTYKNNRKRFKLVGSVNRGYDSFITTQRNKITGKCSYVDDTVVLTKRSKNELVQFFMDKANNGKKVAYLVVPKVSNKNKRSNKNGKK
jgi:hypothetical protein